jgi:hypothetical protein
LVPVSVQASENAALRAEVAALKGHVACLRSDNGHLKARLSIMSERQWAGDRRGIQALVAGGRPVRDTTGFSDGVL